MFAGRILRITLSAMCLQLVLLGMSLPANAQSVTSGLIRGRVADDTGGALPGVTVTATSPALLAPKTDVTDAEGNYRLPDMPIGEYRLTYELAGFQQLAREGIQLSVGFQATVNVVLQIGSVQETITVAGETPVVDVTSTTHAVVLQGKEIADRLPGSRLLGEVMANAPGVQITGRPNLGQGTEASSGGGRVYGVTGQITPLVEGISTRQDADSAGNSPDISTMQELAIVSVGGGASQATPGVALNMVVKSGGNEYHGRFEASGQSDKFQGTNLSDELKAQGIVIGDLLKHNRELSGEFGGRLIRDKLWFYGALQDLNAYSNNLGYSESPGPDGRYQTADDVPGTNSIYNSHQTAKGTYQLSPNYKLIGFVTRYLAWVPERAGNRNNPRESLRSFWYDPTEWKGELQGTVGNRMVFNVLSGKYSYFADYNAQPGTDNIPSSTDLTTQLNLGPNISQDKRPRINWQTTGSLTFFPEKNVLGQHELKGGLSLYTQWNGTGQPNGKHGNYKLTFNNGAPLQITTYNYPLYPKNRLDEYGFYGEDSWRLGRRVNLNLGFRMDYFHSFVPAQTKEQGQFGSAGTFEKREVNTWWVPAPRVGLSYDVFGTGKTVVKALYGRFNHTPGDAYGQNFNLNTIETVTYRWSDPNGNRDYDPGEVNLAKDNNPDFISLTGPLNNVLNPDLEIARTYQNSISVEQELGHNMAASVAYVYLKQAKLYEQVNILRPYSAYNIAIQRVDPGRDGVAGNADDGPLMTVYDYDPAYRGAAFIANQFQNRKSDRDDTYKTIEATVQKRVSDRWGVLASVSATTFRQFNKGIVSSPNDLIFPVNDSTDWNVKLNGSYDLPWNIGAAVTFTSFKGVIGQRTYVFRNLPQSSTLTLPVEPYGVLKNPTRNLLNGRVTKTLELPRRMRMRLALDILNLTNAAPPYTVSNISGPTYGQYSQILLPRILKGGVLFEF